MLRRLLSFLKKYHKNNTSGVVMRRQKLLVMALILANIITLVLLFAVSFRYSVPQKLLDRLGIISIPIKYDYKTKRYIEQTQYFSQNTERNIKIVMLGDSITEGINWNEFLERTDISNQGIGEDTTEGFLNRLEFVYQFNPELCFIMGGVNDLGKNIPVNIVAGNIIKIVESLNKHGIKPIIQSTLCVSKKWIFWEKRNKDIMELNKQLKEYSMENNVLYIDINQSVSKNGILEEQYTNDGVHLLQSGYERWKELIVPIMENQ